VGGGTPEFIDYVKERSKFSIEVVKEFKNGISNLREILEIRHLIK